MLIREVSPSLLWKCGQKIWMKKLVLLDGIGLFRQQCRHNVFTPTGPPR